MLPFSFNPLGYVEHKLTDTLETETAETIFNSVFFGWNAGHRQFCYSVEVTIRAEAGFIIHFCI